MPADVRIGVYKVGGRDGMPSLILPPAFRDDIFDVFFEADESAIAQMQERNDPARSRIFPYCLWDRNGPATFSHNYDPFTSSLLKPSSEFDWVSWNLNKDYLLAEAALCVRKMPVETHRLDSLALLTDPAVAPPTTIFLDTQGSEREILLGGRELIAAHTVAIVTEAEFVPIYQGQALFGDLCTMLDELGFIFAGFADGPFSIEPFCTPLGQRGRSMLGFCDALFLRKPRTLVERPAELAQLAFVALYWEQLAYGFHCLDRLRETGARLPGALAERTYGAFLQDVDAARGAMPILYPPTFSDLFPTYQESLDRFDVRTTQADLETRAVARHNAVQQRLLEHREIVTRLATADDLPIEAVYRRYGLTKQADAVKSRRLNDLTEMLGQFGISISRATPAGGP